MDFAYTIVLAPSFTQTSLSSILHHTNRTLMISYPPQQYLGLPDYLSRMILTLFASERRYIRSVLHRSTNDVGSLPEFARRVVRGSRKYQVTFSLLNGGGEQAVESWDIAEALDCISPLTRFYFCSCCVELKVDRSILEPFDTDFRASCEPHG